MALTTFLIFASSISRAEIKTLNYDGFTIWLDCNKRAAVAFRYLAQRDVGNLKRSNKFKLDPSIPTRCQQKTGRTYRHKYDRGHMVPANHLDHSKTAILQSNFMTNILPQAAKMNRGAWLKTEEITECYRDIEEILVIGGAIWNGPVNKDILRTHGVKTPSAFWKVLIRGGINSERAIGWVIPNNQEATKKRLDEYIVPIKDIERLTGISVPAAEYTKESTPFRSWMIPKGCNRG